MPHTTSTYKLPHPDARHPEANRRKYGGKELLTEGGLNEHDFEARRLTPLGSFSQPDPLASKYPWLSPYAYCAADPINLTDPTGLDWVATRNEDDTLNWSWNETIKSLEEAKEAGYVDYLPNGSLLDNASVNGGKIGSVCLGDGPSDVHYVEPNKTITPWELGVEWLTGEGPKTRRFKDGDNFTELVRKHEHYLNAIEDAKAKIRGGEMDGNNDYSLSGSKGIPKYLKDYSTLLTAGTTGNLATTFLGSYGLSWVASVNGGIATITVTITNPSTMQSATRLPWLGYKGYWQNTIGKEINSLFETGPGSLKTQIIVLTEQFKL